MHKLIIRKQNVHRGEPKNVKIKMFSYALRFFLFRISFYLFCKWLEFYNFHAIDGMKWWSAPDMVEK